MPASTSTPSIWGRRSCPPTRIPRWRRRRRQRTRPRRTRRRNPDLVRSITGYGAINQQQPIGWRTYHSIQIALNRRFRDGLLFGFNDTISLSDKQNAALRLQHNADGTITTRADQAKADELLGDNHPQAHLMRAQFVWDLPRLTLESGAQALWLHRQRLEPVRYLVGATGPGLRVTAVYQNGGGNVNLTGSPDFTPRVRVVGDTGSGLQRRSAAPVQHRGVPWPGRRQRWTRIRERLPDGLLHQQPGHRDRPHHQARRQPQHPAARRRVQPVQSGGHHRAPDADEPDEPERSGDHHQPAVRRRRQRDPRAREAQRRRVRRRHRLSAAARIQLQARFSF